jgi:riboflavin kinase/FMN adenylyltransferase
LNDCVLTIGKFEGVHLGHRALLKEVICRAKDLGLASVVLVFSPHPVKFLRDPEYKPIFTEHERNQLIKNFGIDEIITLNFDSDFAAMTAKKFCEKLDGFNAREIIVGYDYRFGNGRDGSVETLRENSNASVRTVKLISDNDFISSSRIRELLFNNKFDDARQLLGFSFFVTGEVSKGRQLGRVLGFPTLNLYPPEDKYLPQNGVYETRTFIDGDSYTGLTNIGVRPTVSEETKISVETHIPELNADEMYGRQIKVEFLRFIRPERRFDSPEELQLQIQKDLKGFSR